MKLFKIILALTIFSGVSYAQDYGWIIRGDTLRTSANDLYCISVVDTGTYLYKYNSTTDKWDEYEPFKDNAYYRWFDAAFFEANSNSTEPEKHFIVSAVQEWSPPNNTYNKGLYLVTNGQSPVYTTEPITGTSGKDFTFIYRDLENSDILYAWYNDEPNDENDFYKITVTYNAGVYSASVTSDFDILDTPIKILAFYQYLEGANRHQYLVVDIGTDEAPEITVWHRDDSDGSLSSAEWSKSNTWEEFVAQSLSPVNR